MLPAIAGLTGMHHTQLFSTEMRSHKFSLPRVTWNSDPPDPTRLLQDLGKIPLKNPAVQSTCDLGF
jgi:hypothetical protein